MKKRKELELTQRKLARLTGVSRSWIAKVERGILKPSYAQAKRVFEELEYQEKLRAVKIKSLRSLTVKEIHSTNIEYAEVSELARDVWKRMEEKGYSQLPVREETRIIGSVTELGMNKKIIEMNQEDLRVLKVRDLMEDPFPTVTVKTPVSAVVPLLQINQAVITADGSRIVGIVTNTDLGKIFDFTRS